MNSTFAKLIAQQAASCVEVVSSEACTRCVELTGELQRLQLHHNKYVSDMNDYIAFVDQGVKTITQKDAANGERVTIQASVILKQQKIIREQTEQAGRDKQTIDALQQRLQQAEQRTFMQRVGNVFR